MSTATGKPTPLERRVEQHDNDIRFLYRDIDALRREMRQGLRSVRLEPGSPAHPEIEVPGDEEE